MIIEPPQLVMLCISGTCHSRRVDGSHYCEDHLLEKEVTLMQTNRAVPIGSLGDLVRRGKQEGMIKPVAGYVSF